MKQTYRRGCAALMCTSILMTSICMGTTLHNVRNSVKTTVKSEVPVIGSSLIQEYNICLCSIAPTPEPTVVYVQVEEAEEVDEPVSIPAPSVAAEPEYELYNVDLDDDLQAFTYQMCKEYGIEEHYALIIAQMWLESNFNASLISGTNDYGLMQINKCNHSDLKEALGITDFLDPYQNIRCGVYMMSQYLQKYSEHEALMCYNLGEGGAKKNWKVGRYSTNYSRNIMEKKKYLLNN